MDSIDPLDAGAESQSARPAYIDVNAQIGPLHGRAQGAPRDLLAREQRAHGIRLSLVRSRTALLGDATIGNTEVAEASEEDAALLPVAVLSPDRTDDLRSADALDRGYAAYWLEGRATPGRRSVATEELVAIAGRAGRPLFVRIAEYGDGSRVGAATAGLGVPVVLVGTHYDNVVDTLAAARRHDHLLLETSSMAHLGAIEIAVRAIGAERIVLGTGAPLRAIQPSLNAIAQARIPDDAKVAILAGNAERLFGLRPESVPLPEITRVDGAIDVHTHTGPIRNDVLTLSDAELVPELARLTGTAITVASSALAIDADLEAGNRRTVDACASDPRLLGYLVADPDDIQTAREHIRRWGGATGIVGVKIGCEQSRPTRSPAILALFDVLADYGRPVLIHNDGSGWDSALLSIARAYPKLPIIVAHGGLGSPSLEGAALASTADNVYFEMCSSFAQLQIVRDAVRRVPAHKLLYGTDAPLLDPSFVLGTYQDALIPAERQPAVYRDNAAALFQIE